ncbi:MAG: 4Fe-4S binding protein [Methanomassiliicoccaceae archaeon]|nr:4Fe-4S binding protein [Methanomassiliicoccaceae archaeon]
MLRRIIKIDETKCSGCGLCVSACHEGALAIRNGKAKLLRDDYCDGLGNCLPVCPTGAISFEEREAAAYDEAAVEERMNQQPETLACGCPGTHSKELVRLDITETRTEHTAPSHLRQWPVQIELVPPSAPYFKNADLLVAADCSAYACGNFHAEFMKSKVTIIGCPKLDKDRSEKLTAILEMNDIKTITITRMEVPCCGGIEKMVDTALMNCGKSIPRQIVTLSVDGRILSRKGA